MTVSDPMGNGASVDLTATVDRHPAPGETATVVVTGDPVTRARAGDARAHLARPAG